MLRIGIDFGGTNIRAGLLDDGHLWNRKQGPLPSDAPEDERRTRIYSVLDRMPTMQAATIGAGVASVVDGTVLSGCNCGAGKFGTAPYKDSIYAHYCAGLFFEWQHDITGRVVFERVRNGDTAALAMFSELSTHLGRALQSVLHTTDSAHVVIGGFLRHADPFVKETTWAELETFAFPRALNALTFDLSELEHTGILGAVTLGRQERTPASGS